jgi:hypothetical protein
VPSFRLPLVLLSFPVILLVFRDSGFRLLRRTQWIDLFIDEFRIRCLGIVRFCSVFIRSHSSRISPILPLRSLDIFDIHTRYEPSNLRLIDQIRSSRKIVPSPTLPLALSFPYPFPFSSSRRFSSKAALINAKCVNACGKLPRCSPDGLNSSAKRPK